MPEIAFIPCIFITYFFATIFAAVVCTRPVNQSDEDLDDFHTQLALSQRDDGSLSGSIQHELEFNSSDESERLAEGEIHSSIHVGEILIR